jgi:hypothetical protein
MTSSTPKTLIWISYGILKQHFSLPAVTELVACHHVEFFPVSAVRQSQFVHKISDITTVWYFPSHFYGLCY